MARPRVRRGYVRAESEAAFQTAVLQLAGFEGWRTYHPPDNRPSANTGRVQKVTAGWPDVTFWRPPGIGGIAGTGEFFLAELKAENGRVRPDQLVAHDELRACGLEVNVWRPSDWPEIRARLARH